MPDSQVKTYALLHELAPGHALRTERLAGAECRNKYAGGWREVRPGWAIAKHCYDELKDVWTETTEFRRQLASEPAR